MHITLKLNVKLVKQHPYRLNPKYKEKVREEINKILIVGIIELVKDSKFVSTMVVQEKKTEGEIRIYVNLRKLNDAHIHDPFKTKFTYEFMENVGGEEAYSFTNGFSGYHQIRVTPEEQSNTTFSMVE